ncbi:class I SAM-dependent methyltransferase [Streptomyces sp. NPDC087917]|uniref:class I SAM-dependent methyltransferase n=1 Tax=Streptomyces sp. NPDC087917 TaxID=3155060 RepID=UPI00343CD29E
MTEQSFTPALGRLAPTRFHDGVVALTRERLWRGLTALYVAPRAGEEADWRVGRGDELGELVGAGTADTVVSSLVPHQCALPVKRAVLASMAEALRPGGKLLIADYGLQRTRRMRLAFRTVQFADGPEGTRPNAEGVLPELMAQAGFREVREAEVVSTVTGSLSVYVARRG